MPNASGVSEMRKQRAPEMRTVVMRSIRKTNTRPELAVRRALHARGFRFRLHGRDLPGCPDIVLPKHMTAVLVHGCFWHQHEGCRLARLPKGNQSYWLPKLERNVARDRRTRTALEAMGWRVVVIWECETKDAQLLERALARVKKA